MPSTIGVVSRKTSKTALLAAEYADMRGGTTTACGHSARAWSSAHRRAHAERLGLVAGGEHDAHADQHRPAAQRGVVALLDRRVERVEIGVQDALTPASILEHMFEQRQPPAETFI